MMLSIATGIPLLLQNMCLERSICRKNYGQSLWEYIDMSRGNAAGSSALRANSEENCC